ncbi:MAG TPA: glycerol-3-phosphate dehydrogenase/oxidase [Candidatus Limnocylindrales bacterium]|nr:glycerol-3-phosphate dehydrogenase/oxidase [Candidatus Limnocylindrales bacterium]
MAESTILADRIRTRERLATEPLDVLVVGGGITGAGVLLEAARRGLRAGLLEQDDLAVATSSRTSKLIHGGLRYLEQFQFGLVHDALNERARLVREAPHLVRLEPFLVPIYGSPLQLPYIGAGLALYGALGAARGGGIPGFLLPGAARRASPALRTRGLRGGALRGAFRYHDGVEDDARLVVAVVRTALASGGLALTRTRATRLVTEGGRVTGVEAEDCLAAERFGIRAGAVVDATGAEGSGGGAEPSFTGELDRLTMLRSRGIHLVLPRSRLPGEVGLTIRIPGRVVFVIPWGDVWLLGTTDHPHEGPSDRPTATPEEAREVLSVANAVLDVGLSEFDLVASFAGVRPLVAGDGSSTVKAPRTHAIREPAPGLLVIRGGKFTTHGTMARDILDRAGFERRRPKADDRLVGGSGAAAVRAEAGRLAGAFGVADDAVSRLVSRYGDEAPSVLELGRVRDLLRPLDPEGLYLEAEVAWAVDCELALSLDDILARRTRIALERRDHGAAFASRVAEIAGDRLGWDAARQAAEVRAYVAQAAREYDVPPGID